MGLVNGDRMSGLVVAVGPAGLRLDTGAGGGEVVLNWEGVGRVGFSNPDTVRGPGLNEVELADVSRFYAQGVRIEGDQLACEPVLMNGGQGVDGEERRQVVVALDEVRSVVLAGGGGGGRVVGWSGLVMRVEKPAEVFSVVMEPVVGSDWIGLHGPTVVGFRLPPGSERVAAVLTVAGAGDTDGLSGRAAAWADCGVIVRLDGRVVWEGSLSGQQPLVELNCAVPTGGSGDLTLEITEGANGPIGDRILIRESWVYVRPGR